MKIYLSWFGHAQGCQWAMLSGQAPMFHHHPYRKKHTEVNIYAHLHTTSSYKVVGFDKLPSFCRLSSNSHINTLLSSEQRRVLWKVIPFLSCQWEQMSRGMFLSVCVCARQTSCLSSLPARTLTRLFCTVTLWQITDTQSPGHSALSVCKFVSTVNPPTVLVWPLPFLKELKQGGGSARALTGVCLLSEGFINKDDLSRHCSEGACMPFFSFFDSLVSSNYHYFERN